MIPQTSKISKRILGSSLTFSAQGGRGKEKNQKPAAKIFASPSEGAAEGGRGVQISQSGFCSKKVRISSNKHHHIELVASLGASPLASAGSFARKLKGFLKSISSRPAARRRFTNKICIALRAMSLFFSFAKGERQSEILLNCRSYCQML